MDGSIRAYLGKKEVGWDYTRQIDDAVDTATENQYWVEIPQINTEQFRGIDLWVQFDSINALSYYIITKYEENIFSVGPKNIKYGLEDRNGDKSLKPGVAEITVDADVEVKEVTFTIKAGATIMTYVTNETDQNVTRKVPHTFT
jgi:hypothetical protein